MTHVLSRRRQRRHRRKSVASVKAQLNRMTYVLRHVRQRNSSTVSQTRRKNKLLTFYKRSMPTLTSLTVSRIVKGIKIDDSPATQPRSCRRQHKHIVNDICQAPAVEQLTYYRKHSQPHRSSATKSISYALKTKPRHPMPSRQSVASVKRKRVERLTSYAASTVSRIITNEIKLLTFYTDRCRRKTSLTMSRIRQAHRVALPSTQPHQRKHCRQSAASTKRNRIDCLRPMRPDHTNTIVDNLSRAQLN